MPKLTLIEGLPKYEGINEAKAIADVLKIMKRGLDPRQSKNLSIKAIRANSKEHFIKSLERTTDFLHISSHGDRDKNNKTYLYITNGGCIYPDEIRELKIKAKVIFLNACLASKRDMANAFLEANNSSFRFFIAPRKEVKFNEAFIVSLLFYRNAFLKPINIESKRAVFNALKRVNKLGDVKTHYSIWKSL